ncbi:MAG TPA: N-acetylmuramoyl-L-alanine amidase [Bryobacteraceae bacterium]
MRSSGSHVCCLPALLLLAAVLQAQPAAASVQGIRYWSFGDVTRIAVQTQGAYTLHYAQIASPPRVYFDLTGLQPPAAARRSVQTIPVNDERIKDIRVDAVRPGTTRIVFDLKTPVDVISSQLVNPNRLMIELRRKGAALAGLSTAQSVTREIHIQSRDREGAGRLPLQNPDRQGGVSSGMQKIRTPVTVKPIDSAAALPPPPSETHPTRAPAIPATAKAAIQADGSLVRMFGLKVGTIVIDPGHGGHDTGAIGPDGLEEKNVVLDIALRLGKLIRRRLDAQVIYTRSTDVFVPLQERTRIANEAHADLFVSIHANSSRDRSATGVETYFFNLTSDKHGLDVARRENASSTASISQLHDLLHNAVLQTKLDESHQFAQCIQSCLWPMSRRMDRRSQNRGVRHAPFVVLIGATMPSILAEVGFISNRHDEKMLRRGSQRQKIAQALFKGIEEYAHSLTHEQMASSTDQ